MQNEERGARARGIGDISRWIELDVGGLESGSIPGYPGRLVRTICNLPFVLSITNSPAMLCPPSCDELQSAYDRWG